MMYLPAKFSSKGRGEQATKHATNAEEGDSDSPQQSKECAFHSLAIPVIVSLIVKTLDDLQVENDGSE